MNQIKNIFKKGYIKSTKLFGKNNYGLKLENVVYNSYHPKENLNNFKLDKELSSKNQQIYYNDDTNQLLMTIAGTKSKQDVLTDIKLLTGQLKKTDRYKNAKSTLEKAKQKYNEDQVKIVGSSLGGAIAKRIAGHNDQVITYNSAEIGGINRPNVLSVRDRGDIISVLGSNKSGYSFGNPLQILNPSTWLDSHSSYKLKGENIFI